MLTLSRLELRKAGSEEASMSKDVGRCSSSSKKAKRGLRRCLCV